MIDPNVRDVSLKLISVAFAQRRHEVADAITAVMQQASQRGLLYSSITQREICKVLEQEFRERAELAWRSFARAYEHVPLPKDAGISDALKMEIVRLLEVECSDLTQHHARAANLMRGASAMRSLEELRQGGIEAAVAEIELFLLSSRNSTNSPDNPLAQDSGSHTSNDISAPRAFVSYAWESESLKEWVRVWATRMRSDGVDVILDQWHTAPGDQLPAFMERSVRENDFVLIVCTPIYKQKSDSRRGGVGYEGDVITGELMNSGNQRKFIPILRVGEWRDSAPSWLSGKYHVDLRGDSYNEQQYADLLLTLHKKRPMAPPVGVFVSAGSQPSSGSPAHVTQQPNKSSDTQGSIRILGVIVDEVTSPRNDGTRGSALYTVPFRLSREPTREWAEIFVREWNHPSSFSSMHRPGIAKIVGDRLLLDGTTIEEVESVHRATLVTVIRDANVHYERHSEQIRRSEELRLKQTEEHAQRVQETAQRIRFD